MAACCRGACAGGRGRCGRCVGGQAADVSRQDARRRRHARRRRTCASASLATSFASSSSTRMHTAAVAARARGTASRSCRRRSTRRRRHARGVGVDAFKIASGDLTRPRPHRAGGGDRAAAHHLHRHEPTLAEVAAAVRVRARPGATRAGAAALRVGLSGPERCDRISAPLRRWRARSACPSDCPTTVRKPATSPLPSRLARASTKSTSSSRQDRRRLTRPCRRRRASGCAHRHRRTLAAGSRARSACASGRRRTG